MDKITPGKIPHRVKDIRGQKFGRLTPIWPVVRYKGGKTTAWECLCDCGKTTFVIAGNLHRITRSCGCTRYSGIRKHGLSKHPIYKAWLGMISRCYNEDDASFKNYGGRGISVCTRWKESFAQFYADMSPSWVRGLSIDRILVNGNYETGNCRWATSGEQARNRRNSHTLTFNGVTKNLADWATELGVSYFCLRSRIKLGWSVKDIITKPSRACKSGPQSN